MKAIFNAADKYLLDVWASNIVEGWADVMIPPHLTDYISDVFVNQPYHISIQDVQESIELNERERTLSRKRAASQLPIFDDFYPYGDIVQFLRDEVGKVPNSVFGSIGTTYEGNEIHSLHLARSPGRTKPSILIQCGIHAREWITPTHCLWIIDQLTTSDPDRASLLAQFEFVIVPVLNVDGYEFTHTSQRLWRKNRQPNPGSTCVGTDLNRNYAYGWSGPGASNNPCAETYYGSAAFSSPETAASRNAVNALVNDGTLVSFWDLHAYGSLWMSAWGYTCNLVPPDYADMDNAMYAGITACREENGRTYAYGQICRTIYQASGSSVDFGYGTAGIKHSYTTEAFGNNFTPPPSYIEPVGREVWAGMKASFAQILKEMK